MPDIVKVAMADLKVARDPAVLITIGLGSCIGIALYDPVVKVGGLAHIMLPTSKRVTGGNGSNPMKYADTGIEITLRKMVAMSAVKRRITAKIAGGAHMFSCVKECSSFLKIGDNNAAAVKEKLSREGIKLMASDTGKDYGRTVELHTKDGSYVVKTIAKGSKVI
uniref:Probable chemoreceptor glutamine deamidase CheD n=1 Tax=Candidatus Methanogaster sp. ANME-2c ERB4 TaxID=2759911 RepID=A0A7G9YM14_9EURY|nr:chemoreceptor glutamine deamidase CheD [Methanosarcinales archaeon ANME-2c ERB4]QNO49048.1 chemoreceptor glutamine deamidase CheD [Methanosarcinales archaeon ANME-2c ERB4]